MKRFIMFGVLLAGLTIAGLGQMPRTGEFELHSNGLIYSPQDMAILGKLVDSLNLRFKSCDLDRNYTSYAQAPGWYVRFKSKDQDLEMIKEEIEKEKDFEYITSKYAQYIDSKKLDKLIIWINKPGVKSYYLSGSAYEGYETQSWMPSTAFSDGSKWSFMHYSKNGPDDHYYLYCYYLPQKLSSKAIPDQYARLIQYVDCMIDTAATIMLDDDEKTKKFEKISSVVELNNYLNEKMELKKKKRADYEYNSLTPAKMVYAEKNLQNDTEFINLVKKVVDDCVQNGGGGEMIEELASRFVGKDKALEMKRHRRVFGMCSMDDRPRRHARDIAMLSAETHNWDIFLRAHLDIMNDRFDRMSDGSYAYGRRETYLKELEELGLNVTDLMIGLSLRSSSVADGHYNGTVWRLGRALTESKDKEIFETRVHQMLKDQQLDEFNRGLLFILYASYLNHLPTEQDREKRMQYLRTNIADYPAILHDGIKKLEVKQRKY
jgi:hypothetical protein